MSKTINFRLSLSLAALLITACVPAEDRFDVLIVNGTVYDGSLKAGRISNIGIVGERITTMSAPEDATATIVIDAAGKLVTPGFIDPHTHALPRLQDPATSANLNYLLQGVTTVFVGSDGAGVDKRDTTLAALATQGVGPNVAFFAGHGGIRRAVMGMADRAPTEFELETMRRLLRIELDAGAIGLSTGLFYAPGSYSKTDEVIELAKVAARAGTVYDSHIRSESSYGVGLLSAIEEALTIGKAADIPVHISHIKALGQDVWGQSTAIVSMIEAARESGIRVTANQYPWSASGTRFSNALIPRWVMADSIEKMAERLFDPELKPGIDAEMQNNLRLRGGPEAMLVTDAASDYVGMTLGQIALVLEMDPLATAVQVVLTGDPSIASFVMQQSDIDELAVKPWVMTGSDGSSGHPRLFGSYPKVWRDFVHDRKLMSAEQFVHRSSGLVADTFGLCDRGYLKPGYIADIVILNPEKYAPEASYEHPTEYSEGIEQLIINGTVVIDNGHTSKLPGHVLTRKKCN